LNPFRIIDLSHVLHNCMPIWPTQPNLLYEQISNVPRDGDTVNVIHQMTMHTGTHVDVPLHFVVGGRSVDQLTVEAFVGDGIVINLSHKKPREEITVEDVKAFDREIKANDVLMLHTGWDKKLGYNPEYLFEWPYLVEETAEYLVKKKVKALGIDTLSVGGWDEDVPGHGPVAKKGSGAETHRILLGAGVIIIETLRNLDRVLAGARSQRAYFVFAPIAFQAAEGGPCRALALLFE
jgi:arylformamidase